MKPSLLLLAALLGLSQCRHADPAPLSQLPPATQTGAGTIGCLINGQAWTPQGFDGTANYSIDYDQNPYGVFDLQSYRYQQTPNDNYQYLILLARNLQAPTTYDFQDTVNTRAAFYDRRTGCDLNSRSKGTYRRGTLTITRLDKQVGIISGTFAFTLYKPGCDTVKVTNGRFDYHL